jgi:hypothetical protein
MRENDKSKNDRCGFYFHSLNRICSGTTEIERWIWENDISGNSRSRFHCNDTQQNRNICQGILRTHHTVLLVSWTVSAIWNSENKNTASWELSLLPSSVGSVKKSKFQSLNLDPTECILFTRQSRSSFWNVMFLHIRMDECIRGGPQLAGPCTATFNDLLSFPF